MVMGATIPPHGATVLHARIEEMAVALSCRGAAGGRDAAVIVAGDPATLCPADLLALWAMPGHASRSRGTEQGEERRRVVVGASAPARAQGVSEGMEMMAATRLCPEATIVAADSARYRRAAARIWDLYRRLTPLAEPLRLDEAVLDVRGCELLWRNTPAGIARDLGERVRRETALTLTGGLAATRSAAEVAARLAPPGGLRVVEGGQEAAFLAALPLAYLPGMDEGLGAELRALGLATIGQFAALPSGAVARRFGANVGLLHRLANGVDERPVVSPPTPPAMRRAYRCDDAAHGVPAGLLSGALRSLVAEIAALLADDHLSGRLLAVTLVVAVPAPRRGDTATRAVTRQTLLKEHTSSAAVLVGRAEVLLEEVLAERPVRAARRGGHLAALELVVEVGDLAPEVAHQPALFDQVPVRSLTAVGAAERRLRLQSARATLRRRFGPGVLCHMVPLPYGRLPEQSYRVIPLDGE